MQPYLAASEEFQFHFKDIFMSNIDLNMISAIQAAQEMEIITKPENW